MSLKYHQLDSSVEKQIKEKYIKGNIESIQIYGRKCCAKKYGKGQK